jgi:hypothetical protein
VTDVIELHPIDIQQAGVWRLAKEVATALDRLPWLLIGGLMVQLLEAERSVESGFSTGDVDVVLDVRAVTDATKRAASSLLDAGFEPEPYDDNLTYRFVRADDVVDLLAPDHLGTQTSILTVPPASTFTALGSRQALNRSRIVRVDAGDGAFDLPIPTLAGAIVIKAQVVENAAGRASLPKHERDLARLLALVEDPDAERAGLTRAERGYLRARSDMAEPGHRAWSGIRNPLDGIAALRILADARV